MTGRTSSEPRLATLVALLRAFADAGTVAAVEDRLRDRYARLPADPRASGAWLAQGEQHACERRPRGGRRGPVAAGAPTSDR